MPAPTPAATTESGGSGDAKEISRSVGAVGGAVVLWPRIVLPRGAGKPDAQTRALAERAQARLASIAQKVLGSGSVDTRPEPERVCPKAGCKAASLGVLFTRAGNGCAVLALVSGPGASPQRLVQWSPGEIQMRQASVPFREPPESVIGVKDYASCAKLPDALAEHDGEVEAAIRSAVGK